MTKSLDKIELLLLDVDGVLTDGSITYTDTGDQIKTFNSGDGLGLRLLMDSGVQVGIITGRSSNALKHRCSNLNISLLFDGIRDKRKALEEITNTTGIPTEKTAFAGDDLIDLPVMTAVGLSFAVANACREVKENADYVTQASGGNGAVREICERILKAQGKWQTILDTFLS